MERTMADLDRALAEISMIRCQMARSMEFRGLGAATLAGTGVMAVVAATAQGLWIGDPASHIAAYIWLWIGIAACSALMIAAETSTRAVRAHSGLAQEMIINAVGQFSPAAVAGALLTAVLYRAAPAALWMLPGLWQVVLSLGIFASRRSLPAGIGLVGAWYLASGLSCLAIGDGAYVLSPWLMGLPFGVGQSLMALVIYQSGQGSNGEA
jgi:hypothetical protein